MRKIVKIYSCAMIFVALMLALTGGIDTYAVTSADANDSVNIVLHVLESPESGNEFVDIEPDVDPGEYHDDEVVEEDDSGEDADVGEEDQEESGRTDCGDDEECVEDDFWSQDEDRDDNNNSNNNYSGGNDSGNGNGNNGSSNGNGNTAAASGSSTSKPGGLSSPNTGYGVSGEEGIWSWSALGLAVTVALGLVVVIIWHKKGLYEIITDRVRRVGLRNLRDVRFDLKRKHSKVGLIGFGNEKTNFYLKKLGLVVAGMGIIGGMGAMAFMHNNPTEEVEAASDAYPYTISVDDNGDYHLYVKQGDFVKQAFRFKTKTNNPTGYSLSIATDRQTLAPSSGGESNQLAMVSSETTANEFSDNTWGLSLDNNKYSDIPLAKSSRRKIHSTKAASQDGNYVVMYFGAKVAEDLPVGEYTTKLEFKAETNVVKKKLTLANGNVAKVTRVSDGKALANNADIYIGEKLKITNSADAAGITQEVKYTGATGLSGGEVMVSGNVKVQTTDDSIHYLKNDKDGGNGDVILIKSQGKYWLVDTGHITTDGMPNGPTAYEYLKSLGITKVDNLLLTHQHGDHAGGVWYLASKRIIRKGTTVYMRGCEATQNIRQEYDYYGQAANGYKEGCEKRKGYMTNIKVGSGENATTESATIIDFYNHESERANIAKNGLDFGNFHVDFYNIDGSNGHIDFNRYKENLNSIAIKLTHKPSGKTTFLGGDFEYGNEAKYGSKIGKVDIMKASHHGLKTSNTYDFVKTLDPKTVVITWGGNELSGQYAAWAFVAQRGGSVYYTKDTTNKAVVTTFDKNGYSIKNGKKFDLAATLKAKKENWNGGVVNWSRPYNKDGKGGDKAYFSMSSADDSKHTEVTNSVYVYGKKTNGNVIMMTDWCSSAGYRYGFKSDNGNGVSNLRTKPKTCKV